jgi:hypothetical protein
MERKKVRDSHKRWFWEDRRCSEYLRCSSYASGLMSRRSMTISASWVLIGAKGPGTEREGGGEGKIERGGGEGKIERLESGIAVQELRLREEHYKVESDCVLW